MKEKTLSEKWIWSNNMDYQPSSKAIQMFKAKDVKEAVEKLKGTLMLDDYFAGSPRGEGYYKDIIDKIFGEFK